VLVGIATTWTATIWKTKKSEFDARQVKEIFLFSIMFRPPLGPTRPPVKWVPEALSLEVKRQGREADYSPPSDAEVNNDGAISPLPDTSSCGNA
jgi:hypothetical protein